MGIKISQLPGASQVNAADEFEIVQAGVSKRASPNLPWVFGAQVTVGSLVSGAGTFSGAVAANAGLTASALTVSALTSGRIPYASAGGLLADSVNLQWDNANSTLVLGTDAKLVRDAANTLAQRSGVNAQAFRLYNTFTDAANYERASLEWSANELFFNTQGAGTGSNVRQLSIQAGRITVRSNIGFAQWFFDTDNTGNLHAVVDNTFDIGRSGANRPRTGYFGTSLVSPFVRVDNTAVGAAVADSVQVYSSDDAAGHTIPSFYCEGTNVLATGQADSASSVRVKMRINGTVVTLLAI